MSHSFDDKKQKSRKAYRCRACVDVIPKGFIYIKSSFVNDGSISSDRWHIECREEFCNYLRENGEYEGDPDCTWEGGVMPDELRVKYGLGALDDSGER